jgi:hypothetical protein
MNGREAVIIAGISGSASVTTSDIAEVGRQSGSNMHSQQAEPKSSRFSGTNQPAAFAKPRSRHGGTLRTICPHCQALAKVRSSKQLTPLFKELRFQCQDLECGHTFVASLNIDRTIVPSLKPNPRIKLKVGLPRPTLPANDDV